MVNLMESYFLAEVSLHRNEAPGNNTPSERNINGKELGNRAGVDIIVSL